MEAPADYFDVLPWRICDAAGLRRSATWRARFPVRAGDCDTQRSRAMPPLAHNAAARARRKKHCVCTVLFRARPARFIAVSHRFGAWRASFLPSPEVRSMGRCVAAEGPRTVTHPEPPFAFPATAGDRGSLGVAPTLPDAGVKGSM